MTPYQWRISSRYVGGFIETSFSMKLQMAIRCRAPVAYQLGVRKLLHLELHSYRHYSSSRARGSQAISATKQLCEDGSKRSRDVTLSVS